jgi:hypothetical protein
LAELLEVRRVLAAAEEVQILLSGQDLRSNSAKLRFGIPISKNVSGLNRAGNVSNLACGEMPVVREFRLDGLMAKI